MGIDLCKFPGPVKVGHKPSGLTKLMRLNSTASNKCSDAVLGTNSIVEGGLTSDSSSRSLMSDGCSALTASTSCDDFTILGKNQVSGAPGAAIDDSDSPAYQHHKHQGSNTTIGPVISAVTSMDTTDSASSSAANSINSPTNSVSTTTRPSSNIRRCPPPLRFCHRKEDGTTNRKALTFACPIPDRESYEPATDRQVVRSPFIDKFPRDVMFADDEDEDEDDDDFDDFDDEYYHYDEDCDTDIDEESPNFSR